MDLVVDLAREVREPERFLAAHELDAVMPLRVRVEVRVLAALRLTCRRILVADHELVDFDEAVVEPRVEDEELLAEGQAVIDRAQHVGPRRLLHLRRPVLERDTLATQHLERLGAVLELAVVDHVVVLRLMVEERVVHRRLRAAGRAAELEERAVAHLFLERRALLRVDALIDRELALRMAARAGDMDRLRVCHMYRPFRLLRFSLRFMIPHPLVNKKSVGKRIKNSYNRL